MNYLKHILKVHDLKDLQPDYDEGTLVLSDSQAVIDECLRLGQPVAAYSDDDSSQLRCDYILMDVDDIDDYVFERVYRRCKGIPWDISDTARTYIREFSMEDLDDLFELYAKPDMTDYMEPLFEYEKEKDYQANYIEYIYKLYDFGMWLIYDKITNRLIGRAGIEVRETCQEEGQAELGFCIASDRWGQGLAYEVCSEIIRLAKEEYGLSSLIARCDPNNKASRGLLEKLGFTLLYMQEDGDCRYVLEI
ncbi:Protein N-acetyltransferase, RimJ/RimL family [Pseudobutyrivibrio sp. YE44]|uniref:GNAT family N-acetyltransferase n=1 Tax=Pseudobutyrivibrio sp. YE44 TaxID=1520802 RepID=UPI00088DDCFC|nr:GNAT family N-acetyltransferase [Pseudobutyrivibrio sp. YE44]SDB21615.1 Protein N-acetyltransferase, RimJ/RimL family [Pseudobutyrivibrio sp. YE44]